jgi:hypothetical protein
VVPVPFLADVPSGSTGVGRLLVAPVPFLADVPSGSTGVGRLLVEPVFFLADVPSGRHDRLRGQRHPRLGRACWISRNGTRKCPDTAGRSLHGRGDGRGSPLRSVGPRRAGADARRGGERRGQPWERHLGGCALFRRHERGCPIVRRRRGLVGGERSPASAWSKSRPRSVTCSVARTLPLPDAAANEHGPASYEHGPAANEHGPATNEHGPATNEHGPAAHDHGPAAHDHGPAAHDHGPAANDRAAASDRTAANDRTAATDRTTASDRTAATDRTTASVKRGRKT